MRHQRGWQLVHAAVGHLQANLEPGVRRLLGHFFEGTNINPGVAGNPFRTGSKIGSFDFGDAIYFRAVYKM